MDASCAEPAPADAKVTTGMLLAAIPKHCFERSLPRSLLYLVRDYAIILLLLSMYERWFQPTWMGLGTYWIVQGFFLWCLFVVGHDCGHGSFSAYPWLNAVVGHLAHAPLLVPFWPWRWSHRQHHTYHQHFEKDRSHPWLTEETRIVRWFRLSGVGPLFGWPLYLVAGMPDGSHYWPWSYAHETTEHRLLCALSALSCVACLAAYLLYFGVREAVMRVLIPVLVQGWWLTTVTYLQHHRGADTEVYHAKDWSFVKGALQTVDREFGWPLDQLHHHITDGHLVHHVCTSIPHYHLMEATEHVYKTLEARSVPYHRVPLVYSFAWTITHDFWRYGHLVWRYYVDKEKKAD
jgi:omega-3 fatty acid desaturase (delta-15 desaturase)